MNEVLDLDLRGAAKLITNREILPSELTAAAIVRIEAEPEARACFIRFDKDAALARAHELDGRREQADLLLGIPLAHKDLFSLPGRTASFAAHPDFHLVGSETATALSALDSAGSVNLGGLHLSEFAMGPAGWSSQYGFLANPRDSALVTGGSSGGSAAAVARRLVHGALGTDTGGSIRIPAAFCGVVGLKPSVGLVPSHGCLPVSDSLDTIGPITRTVGDCARMLDALLLGRPGAGYERALVEKRPVRFGILDAASLPQAPDVEVADAFERTVSALGGAGFSLRKVAIANLADLATLSGIVFLTEAGAEHAARLRSARELVGPQVGERLLQGLAYPGSLYLLARKARDGHLAALRQSLFSEIDVLLLPTAPALPPRRDRYEAMADTGAILDFNSRLGAYTPAFSYLGVPALSLPVPLAATGGFGLQMVADHGQDALLLQAAHAVEGLSSV